MIGTSLSHFRITAKLGEGGMGEVYRAEDTKLGREVAIKILPEAFTEDPERFARFEREARVLASLNHPNIAAIYDLAEDQGTHFLVLELAVGEDLAVGLSRGPIPVVDALPLALQITEALEAAHESGIVHRDLKPANVMVGPDGTVKVLDFGLAKAWEPEAGSADLTQSPTLTAQMTQAGVILGTAAYMSPEQARGQVVDKRADIWAFGVVLYEMLCGERPFAGENVSETLARVIEREPDLETLPLEMRRLVGRCLEKDPRQRMRDIGDVRIELSEGTAPTVSDEVSSTKRKVAIGYAVAGLVGGLFIAAGFFSSREPDVVIDRSVRRATIKLPAGQTQPRALYQPLALSPDGTQLVYVAEDETGPNLYVRRMDSFEVRRLPGTSYASTPFFSPDGRSIGFFTTSELKTISIDQGSPVTLASVRKGVGGSWGSDDTIVYSADPEGLFKIAVAGGAPERLTEPDFAKAGYAHLWPSHLPGGQRLLFTQWGGDVQGTHVVHLDTGELGPFLANAFGANVLPSGHVLFSDIARSPSLLAAPVDDLAMPAGAAIPVVEGVQFDRYYARHFAAVSSNGTLVYAPSTEGEALLQWLDREGGLTPIRGHELGIASPRLSPSGDRVAFQGRRNDIWILDLGRGSLDLLVPRTLEYGNFSPVWAPDGRSLTFSSNRSGESWGLYEVTPGGEPTELLVTEYDLDPQAWSPDGQFLVFAEGHLERGMDLLVLPRGGEPRDLLATQANEFASALSPDGRWLAYVSDHTGGLQVYVREFPDGESLAVSAEGGAEPRWSADGSELYYRRGENLYASSLSTQPQLELSVPRLILNQPFDRNNYQDRAAYDVASDGRFLVVTNTWNTELRVVFNWFEELKRLLPAD